MFIKNNLSNFFESQIEKESTEKVLYFDMGNLQYRCLFVAHYQDPTDTKFDYWKYLIINSLFSNIRKFSPDKVVLAFDCHSEKNWRKNIYSQYKAHRKELREKSAVDFEKFFEVANKFFDDMKKYFTNLYFMHVGACEADDILAVCCNTINKNIQNIVISSDKDMIQLLINKNVQLYDPIKRKYKESINPSNDLEIKVIMGDKGDGVPAIRKKIGIKTASKLLSEGLQTLLNDSDIKNNYERNKQLIDLKLIPTEYINKIEYEYKNYPIKKYNGMEIWNFLLSHNIRKFADELSLYSNSLKNLS